MKDLMSKFKIPTLLGLGIIFFGIIAGVYLNLKDQIYLSKAAPDLTPQNITITNITEDSATISWQTRSAATSFITFGQNSPGEQTALDDQDNNPAPSGAGPKPHLTHYVTLKNLMPKTNYQFKVIAGKTPSGIERFQTAQPLTAQTGFTPIIGSVLAGDAPLNEGIAYLSIPGAITQSAPVKAGGNFLIPLSFIRKTDLSDIYRLSEDTIGKITIISDKGTANLLFKLKTNSPSLAPIKLGQNIDLTTDLLTEESTVSLSPTEPDLDKYDLNNDRKINAADYAIISSCIGKKTTDNLQGDISCAKADINKDNKINQNDLDLISQKLKDSGLK